MPSELPSRKGASELRLPGLPQQNQKWAWVCPQGHPGFKGKEKASVGPLLSLPAGLPLLWDSRSSQLTPEGLSFCTLFS